jgi:hypothetical protein
MVNTSEKGIRCVVVYNTFDPEVKVYTGKDTDKLLYDLYHRGIKEEIEEGSDLDEEECFIEKGWGQITWADGEQEFFVSTKITEVKDA